MTTARCACGALDATFAGAPMFAIICHCRDCRRRTGSAFGAGLYFARDAVTLHGDSREFARPTDSGSILRSRFCPTCGTSLAWTIDAHPELIAIAIGTVDAVPPDVPLHSLWEQGRHDWVAVAASGQRQQRGLLAVGT